MAHDYRTTLPAYGGHSAKHPPARDRHQALAASGDSKQDGVVTLYQSCLAEDALGQQFFVQSLGGFAHDTFPPEARGRSGTVRTPSLCRADQEQVARARARAKLCGGDANEGNRLAANAVSANALGGRTPGESLLVTEGAGGGGRSSLSP